MTMKFISIEEIFGLFTPSQRKEVLKVLKESRGKPPEELTKNLKEVFRKYDFVLIPRGIYPEYLAYAFSYVLSQVGLERAINELERVI